MSLITVVLSANGAALRAGLQGAKKAVNSWSEEVRNKLLGAFAFGAAVEGVKQVLEKARELVVVSDRYKIGIDNMQKYANAAKLTGGQLNILEDTFENITDKQQSALAGNESYIQSFKALGIEVDSLRGKNTEEVFLMIADGLKKSTDKADAFAQLLILAGERGKEMFAMMEQGGEAMKTMGDQMHTWSSTTIYALSDTKVEVDKLTEQIKGGLGIAFVFVANVVKSTIAGLAFFFRVNITGFLDVYNAVSKFIQGVLKGVDAIKALLNALISLVTFDFDGASKSWDAFTQNMEDGFNTAVGGIKESWDDFTGEWRRGMADYNSEWDEIWKERGPNAIPETGPGRAVSKSPTELAREAERRKAAEEKLADARKAADEAREKAYLDLLTIQEKIDFLKQKELELGRQANDTTVEGLEALKEVYEVRKEIGDLQQELDKQAEDAAERIKKLEEQITEAERDAKLDQLDVAGQILEIEQELAELRATQADSEEERLKNRLKELELEGELRDLQREKLSDAKSVLDDIQGGISQGLQAPADFLQQIGGGGNVSQAGLSSTQAMLDEYKKQRAILEEIARNTGETFEAPTLLIR